MTGESETSQRVCEHEGCDQPGKFRAPKAPDVLDDFYWFCKDHVREYNAKWSFFDGKTEAEMNAQESSDRSGKERQKTGATRRQRLGRGWELRTRIRFSVTMQRATLAEPRPVAPANCLRPSVRRWRFSMPRTT